MGTTWRYRLMDQEFGPVPLELLTELARCGHLSLDAEVREESSADWTTASAVKELADDLDVQDLRKFLDSLLKSPAPVVEPVPEPAVEPERAAFWAWLPPLVRSTFRPQSSRTASTWQFRALGEEFGPLPFADLLELAQRGEIAAGDMVKSSIAPRWVLAEDVPELRSALIEFQGQAIDEFLLGIERPSKAALDTRSPAAPEISTDGSTANRNEQQEPVSAPSTVPSRPSAPRCVPGRRPFFSTGDDDYVIRRAAEPADSACDTSPRPTQVQPNPKPAARPINATKFRRFSPEKSWRSRFGSGRPARLAFIAAALLIAVGVTVVAASRRTEPDDRNWSRLYAIWSEFDEYCRTDAASLMKSDFLLESRREVASIVKDLEWSSSAKEPAKQNMLWAARDYLLPMLDNPANRDEIQEVRFREQMLIARKSIGLPEAQYFVQQ